MKRILKPQPHGGVLHNFPKGVSGNPKGGAKKLYNVLKTYGYQPTEIYNTLQNMQGLTLKQLKDAYTNEKITILERTVAHAIFQSFKKGDLNVFETIWDRWLGKPKNSIEAEVKQTTTQINFDATDPVEAARIYQKIIEG